jgi:hypothetical protein
MDVAWIMVEHNVVCGENRTHFFHNLTHLAFPCAAVTFQFRPHPSYIHYAAASHGHFGRGNGTVAGSQRARNQKNRHPQAQKIRMLPWMLDDLQQHPKSRQKKLPAKNPETLAGSSHL